MDAAGNESAAIKAYKEVQGLPIDKVVARANKAVDDKEWVTANLLFAHISRQAIVLSAHMLKQATDQLKGDMDGTKQED